ncbi:MAG TPA: class I SAM-dependent methyltransferase [Phycisphaerae bacterium]|nr:class I SAM-dependent methyltransferase [Phycisphaerae bacterium]
MDKYAIFSAMPAPVQWAYLTFKDFIGLRSVDSAAWDQAAARRLRSGSEVDLRSIFNDPRLDAEWARIKPELDSLAITDQAWAVNPGDRRAIYYLIRKLGLRSVLELGTHIGGSTMHFALALRELQRESGGDVSLTTVDIIDVNDPKIALWKQRGSTYSPSQMVQMTNCAPLVEFVTKNSLDYYPACRKRFDLVFIDSSHWARETWIEIVAAMKVLNDRGLLLLHDYYPGVKRLWPTEKPIPGPYRAVRHLQKSVARDALQDLPLGRLPWPTRLGSDMTSLALLAGK